MNEAMLAALYARLRELDVLITTTAIEGMQDRDGVVQAQLLDDAILFARTDDSEES